VALPEHIEIMTAMNSRNGTAASQAMRNHLENSRTRLDERLNQHIATKIKT
jgi:DNA-binding FadR family transcriptional regulator